MVVLGGVAVSYERGTPVDEPAWGRQLGFRPLTPNAVELMARGGLVLHSVIASGRCWPHCVE